MFRHLVYILVICASSVNTQAQNVLDAFEFNLQNDSCSALFPLTENILKEYNESSIFWFKKGLCEIQLENFFEAKSSLQKSELLGYRPLSNIYYNLAKCELFLDNNDGMLFYIDKTLKTGMSPELFKKKPFDTFSEDKNFLKLLDAHEPSFNKWTSLFLFVAFQGIILFLILLFRKKGNKKANLILGFFVLAFTLTLFNYVLYWSGYIWVSPLHYFDKIFVPLSYLFGPLLYLYIGTLYKNPITTKEKIYHFSPFAIASLILIISYSVDKSNSEFFSIRYFVFNPWTRIMQMLVYGVMIFNMVKRESYNSDFNVSKWLYYLRYAYSGLVFSYILYFSFVNLSFFNRNWDYIISIAISVFIGLISIMGYIQPEIFLGFKIKEVLNVVKYKKSGLSESLALELKQKLIRLMIDDQVYKDNSINLEKLSLLMNTNRHNTSQLINEYFNENFFDFLNDFRVDESKDLLMNKEDHGMNITEILYSVGFNNKVSFNNAFKKRTGLTPTQYRNRMSQVS